jgi:hypothetical protein
MYYAMYNVNYNWKLVLRNDRHKRDACASGGKLTVEKLQQAGFEVIEFKVPLKDKYKNLVFRTTGGGNPIDPATMISVILKKK